MATILLVCKGVGSGWISGDVSGGEGRLGGVGVGGVEPRLEEER